MEKDVIHINKELCLKLSNSCWKAGKKNISWAKLEIEIEKMFKEINNEELSRNKQKRPKRKKS